MSIQPGLKIICNGRVGTLGLIVKRKEESHKTYLLCCWHVLDDNLHQGDIVSPTHNHRIIAHYRRSEHTALQNMDAAIAELMPNLDLPINNTVLKSEKTIAHAAYWKKRMSLRKTGAGTGVTRCIVEKGSDYFGDLQYGLVLKQHPAGRAYYCDNADSGAIWCSIKTGKGIAMHTKGQLAGNKAGGAPLVFILEALNLLIV